MLLLQQTEDIQAFKLLVSHSSNASIELLLGQFVGDLDAIFMLHDGGIGPRVVDGDVEVVLL